MELALFPTELGWFALVGENDEVHRLTIGHPDEEAAREAVLAGARFDEDEAPLAEADGDSAETKSLTKSEKTRGHSADSMR